MDSSGGGFCWSRLTTAVLEKREGRRRRHGSMVVIDLLIQNIIYYYPFIPWVNTNQPSSGVSRVTRGGLSKDSKFSYGYACSAVDGKLVGLFGVFDDHGVARATNSIKDPGSTTSIAIVVAGDIQSQCSTQLARVAPGNQLQLKFVILHEAKGTYVFDSLVLVSLILHEERIQALPLLLYVAMAYVFAFVIIFKLANFDSFE
ncbi:hypothetical protein E3N88_07688 [Mikania micrantha]|uniref:Uncharacterized protein n=1 Tax=Mikania micrantha TaxID=192012 RepID=A0A5N6PG62_9ASTR|nr:hypothetical protein E3N88_07688 [Mikania micrantha]